MKKHKKRSLVFKSLENVSKEVFKRHAGLITELIGRSPGIYALYDDMGLYYVGKSVNLKGRVKHHLKDRHKASWTRFSLYLLRHEDHVDEMESLLIRISNPKGNRIKPNGRLDGALLKTLKTMVKEKQEQEYAEMFELKVKENKKKKRSKDASLAGLVEKRTKLFRTYKGIEYSAILTRRGDIRLKGKVYKNPSAAGESIVKHGCNGWKFWYLKDADGNVISLDDLRK